MMALLAGLYPCPYLPIHTFEKSYNGFPLALEQSPNFSHTPTALCDLDFGSSSFFHQFPHLGHCLLPTPLSTFLLISYSPNALRT